MDPVAPVTMSPMVKSIIKGAVDAIPETVEVAALTIPSAISDKLCDLLGGGEAAKPKADLARHALAAALVDFLRTCTGQE